MSESDLKSVDFQLFSLEKRTIKYNATASDQEKAAETLSPEPSPSQVIQLVAVKIFEQGFRSVDAYLNERYKQVEERLKDPSLREKILEAEKSGLLLKDTALYTNAKRDDPDRYQELRQRIFILASVMKVIEQPEYVHPFLKLQVSQRNPRILKAYREEIQRTQWKRQKNRSYRRLSKWRKGLEFPNKKKIIDEPSPLSQTFVYD